MTFSPTRWLALLWLLSWPLAAAALDDYQLLDDFYNENPQQLTLARQLRTQVQDLPRQAPEHLPPIRIAVVYPAQQKSDYWRRSLQVFTHRLDRLGLDYQLERFFTRPVLDETELKQQLRDALQSDPDYLIFTLDSPAHRKVIERLLVRGRPKLILQNITTPLRDWQTAPPLLYTGFDHQQGTRILADTLFVNPTEPAPQRISVIFRDRGYVSAMRGQTFIKLAQLHGAEVVSRYYTAADQESARLATLDALDQNSDIDLFYACSTDVAFGIQAALKERGVQHRIRVNGWGGGVEELDAIARGELDLTVVRLNEESSIAMAEAILNDQLGLPVPQVYSGEMRPLTRQQPASIQNALRALAFPHSREQP
ncbi:substrate-binding domain-containing protein [Motiliproteus sediminis]|uniref:substrate-binding domain-containing protein n=1 Tax=Motiliproteus sediminis TaxID=1468178 RepID=UPI001AEFB0E5|nr:substrate-binding domain-containing protein [Motiliproteus sediminis]